MKPDDSITLALPSAELLPPERNPYLLYLASLAPGVSRSTMACSLRRVSQRFGADDASRFAWHHLRRPHLLALRAWLLDEYAPSSASKMLSGTRAVLHNAWRSDLLSSVDYERTIDLPPIRATRELAGRALDYSEVVALFRACGTNVVGRRDAAVLGLLYGCGLRRSEIVATDAEHLVDRPRRGIVVRGKGDVERTVFFPAGSARALDAWLALRGSEPGPLFLRCTRKRIVEPRARIGRHNIVDRLELLLSRGRVAHCSPHDFRRTFVGDLLDAAVDVSTIRDLAGHRSVETTIRYDRRGMRARAQAADVLSVPFADAIQPPPAPPAPPAPHGAQ